MKKGTRLTVEVMRVLTILCLLIASMGLVAAGSEPEDSTFGGTGQTLGHFVIADFDGDQKPDFATVNVDRTFIYLTEYSVHLQLSQGFDSAIGVTAPPGGLQLFSRDVNGDDILDVVVRTALDSNLVAVLINDGHGKFTLAKPEQFPALEKEPETHLSSEARPQTERILLLPSRSSAGDSAEFEHTKRLKTVTEPLRAQKKREFNYYLYYSNFGRSPPAVI